VNAMRPYSPTEETPALVPVQKSSSQRQPAIEGLRGLAMTLVFFGHFETLFSHYLPPASASSRIVSYFAVWGHRGISFFLVITGYFVYRSFLNRQAEYVPFVKRRLLHIFPLYWSMLGLYLALSVIFSCESKLPHNPQRMAICILENLLLLPGIGGGVPIITVSWALSYLVLAYLAIPPLVRFFQACHLPPRRRVFIILAGVMLWLQVCKVCTVLSSRAVMLAIGMLLCEAVRRERFVSRFTRRGEIGAVCVLILAMSLWHLCNLNYLWFLPAVPWSNFYRYLFLGTGLFCFCAYCFAYDGVLSRFFARPIMRFLGSMSYSYYLVHGVTLKGLELAASSMIPAARQSEWIFWCALPVGYAMTLCAARVVFVMVEQPLAEVGVVRHIIFRLVSGCAASARMSGVGNTTRMPLASASIGSAKAWVRSRMKRARSMPEKSTAAV
jgi:exopolysaccharide production protein ExoZ